MWKDIIKFCLKGSLLAPFFLQAETFQLDKIDTGIFVKADVIASSEPVSIDQMVNGWRRGYRSGGEYAFANAEWLIGANLFYSDSIKLSIAKDYRHYYYMTFGSDTADFFFHNENKIPYRPQYDIDLEVFNFVSRGVSFAAETELTEWIPQLDSEFKNLTLGSKITYYQPHKLQFGKLKGQALALDGGGIQASAVIDYTFNEDKILETDHDVNGNATGIDEGKGLSWDISADVEWKDYRAYVELKDAVNQFTWENAWFLEGCINILNQGNGVACSTSGTSEGKSGRQKVSRTIPMTLTTLFDYTPWGARLSYQQHDRFYRFGMGKQFDSKVGKWGVFLYHPLQIGASWQYGAHKLEIAADDSTYENMRNIQLSFSTGWRF